MKKILVFLTMIALLSAAIPAFAQEKEILPPDPTMSGDFTASPEYLGEKMIVDAAIIKPLGFVATLVGMVAFVPVYAFGVTSHTEDRVCYELVGKPFNFTFKRPVGDIDF